MRARARSGCWVMWMPIAAALPWAGCADERAPAGCDAAALTTGGSFTLDVGVEQRHYLVTLPDGYDPKRRYALVLALHDRGGSAGEVAATSDYFGVRAQADDEAIFVAGQGVPDASLDPRTIGWANVGGADVAYARAVLEQLGQDYCIDGARIFSVGLREGGAMSERLGCELGDVLRGMASIADGEADIGGPSCTSEVASLHVSAGFESVGEVVWRFFARL